MQTPATPRRRALCLLSLATLLNLQAASAMTLKEIKPQRLNNELVMQIDVQLGPQEDMGTGDDGHRVNYPIIGGTFVGKGMSGTVIPGGADMSVERSDRTSLIDALYRLKTADGQVIIIHNAGIWRLSETGQAKKDKGLGLKDLADGDVYCRTIPSFKTQPGPYDWLGDNIFVGTIDGISEHEVLISVYKVGGS